MFRWKIHFKAADRETMNSTRKNNILMKCDDIGLHVIYLHGFQYITTGNSTTLNSLEIKFVSNTNPTYPSLKCYSLLSHGNLKLEKKLNWNFHLLNLEVFVFTFIKLTCESIDLIWFSTHVLNLIQHWRVRTRYHLYSNEKKTLWSV